MTTAELVANVLLTSTGEPSSAVSGDADWSKVISLANLEIDAWAAEPDIDWVSLYSIVPIGTVTATDTFDLDSSIRKISNQEGDVIRIVHTDGNHTDYSLIPPNRLKDYSTGKYVAKIGSTLVFNNAFVSTDPEFGGTINVPAYLYPDHLVNDSDEVPVDDPNWLVMSVAAEWARTDLTLAQNYPLILAKANQLMINMKQSNGGQINTVPKAAIPNFGQNW